MNHEYRLVEAIEALQKIYELKDKTLLSECCVNKTCSPHYEDGEKMGHCTFQFGINQGYQGAAMIAAQCFDDLGIPARPEGEKK